MVQKKKMLELRILFFLGSVSVCLTKSSDCLIAPVVELFRSLTAGSFSDPSLHVISSGIRVLPC